MQIKKIILSFLALASNFALAETSAFLVKEKDKIHVQEGDCKTRYAPCSTFKIVISLMGYDSGFLIDETHPELPFKKDYVAWLERWKAPHNPSLWIKNSCLWYSQVVTKKLGMRKFKAYMKKLNYGNQDVSGDKGKNNGITNAWLSSSLEISPEEQLALLEKLVDHKLPVSRKSQEMTKNILFLEELPGGWKLYGKTGSGSLLNCDRTQKLDIQHGWFIGWIEKDQRVIIFVHHVVDSQKQDSYAGPRAKGAAKEKLLKIIATA